MDFETFDKYTDATFARNFEGLDLYLNLSSEEMAMVKEENKWMLREKDITNLIQLLPPYAFKYCKLEKGVCLGSKQLLKQ